jgi:acetyltransferase-like isoleucine patch superfamily enzyme
MNLAPIVLFVYNRPVHTKKTLEALQRNHLASESVLYIYADGGKENVTVVQLKNIEETRRIIKEQQWCGEVHIIESSHNRGLAASIIHGVTEVVGQYGNVIVLEDDIVTSTGFLNYMNDALNFYEDISEVMHISGYMYPQNSNLPETFFYNVTLCWGWATWKSAWKYYINDAVFLWKEISRRNLFLELNKFGGDYLSAQLAQNISGKLDTWFIKWHASVLLKNGFTLFPRISLVDNIGFDSSGVHNGSFNEFEIPKLIDKIQVCEINLDENKTAAIIFKNFYAQLGIKKIKKHKFYLKVYIKKTARKILLKLLPEIRKNYFNQNTNVLTNSVTGINVKLYEKARLTNSIIGDYSYVAQNSVINNTIIGKFCSIGPNLICGWGVHPIQGISTHPMFYSVEKQNGMTLSSKNKIREMLPIEIGNDVFIGMNVTILDGVSIGNGAVIGAGAVVSKDIPDFAIAVGNPIKIIKYRFETSIIDQLLKVQWWNLKGDQLKLIERSFFDVEVILQELAIEN